MEEIEGSKDSRTPTKIPQSVKKRDNKVKTFASKDSKIDSLPTDFEINSLPKDFEINSLPKSNNELNRSKNLKDEYEKIYILNLSKLLDTERDSTELKKLDIEQIEKDLKDGEFYQYELNISDSRIKYLDKIIKENPKMSNKKTDTINRLKMLYKT